LDNWLMRHPDDKEAIKRLEQLQKEIAEDSSAVDDSVEQSLGIGE